MRIVFFGSDDFAAVHLEQVFKSRHEVVACVTAPDAKQGRGMKVHCSPVKLLAGQHGVPCLQPEFLKTASVVDQLKTFNADLFVVVAYGQILTQAILDIPRILCLNVHGSLLPKYRGAAPVNWAILNGDDYTGVTVQKVVLSLDAGDILAQTRIDISPQMGADDLRLVMAGQGALLLLWVLDQVATGKYTLTPQDPAQVTLAPKLSKSMGRMDWSLPAQVIYNQLRGLKPWPGSFTFFRGRMIKVLRAELSTGVAAKKPGIIIAADRNGIEVACGQGSLVIKEVIPEAGKAMTAVSFISGHKIVVGDDF